MNKNLIEAVKEHGQYKSNVEAKVAIASVTAAIQSLVNKGEDVQIIGFGAFRCGIRKGRSGEVAGKSYTTQDKKTVSFKVGKQLAESALG